MTSTSCEDLARHVLSECLAGRVPSALPRDLVEEPCAAALFAILVEGLSDRFEPALELWATVLSTPEPGLAITGFGRRDAPEDHGLPIVKAVLQEGVSRTSASAIEVFELNDQHAFLRLSGEIELSPGDILVCGISHPCTAFDKWRAIPVVDGGGVICDVIETYF